MHSSVILIAVQVACYKRHAKKKMRKVNATETDNTKQKECRRFMLNVKSKLCDPYHQQEEDSLREQ